MSNTEFNDFYKTLLTMDEDELHETVLNMASIFMENQKRKVEHDSIKLNIRKERVM